MNEEEILLGQIAYEAYCKADIFAASASRIFSWEEIGNMHKRAWIAAAKAVAEHVMQELRTAEEASE